MSMDAVREQRNETDDKANTSSSAPPVRANPPPATVNFAGPPAIRLSNSDEAQAAGAEHTTVVAPEVVKNPGGGEPLQPQVRKTLEQSLGQDLQSVRVHKDERSNLAADSLGAHAFTHGPNIFLGSRAQPSDTRLMAHEVAHVVQQKNGPQVQTSKDAAGADGLEREADRVAAVVQQGGQTSVRGRTGGARVQGSFSSSAKSAASGVGSAVGGGVSAVGGAVLSGARAVGSGIGSFASKVGSALISAFNAAARALGRVPSWIWYGLASLSSTLLAWLSKASRAVWVAIMWFGALAWKVITLLGAYLWEKLALMGALAWSFISNLPFRIWRIVVHYWHAITGTLGWLWSGLRGAAGWAWDAVVGIFSWLGQGLIGALGWLKAGLLQGAAWALAFIMSPSLNKLWHGLLGALLWLAGGVAGLVRWGWHGVVGAALWAWRGIRGLSLWLWEGFLGGLTWLGMLILYFLELIGLGEALQLFWGLIFRLRRLASSEIGASQSVHASGQVPYRQVRVDDNSLLIRIGNALTRWFKISASAGAVTTMHVLHFPAGGVSMDTVVHELSHVAQYEQVGAVYMPQALHGQRSAPGYDYGDLAAAWAAGKHFSDFNREQQAQICEDYYKALNGLPTQYGGTLATLLPFINEMRAGRF
jgi:Domain of unknown function (DUF4157)